VQSSYAPLVVSNGRLFLDAHKNGNPIPLPILSQGYGSNRNSASFPLLSDWVHIACICVALIDNLPLNAVIPETQEPAYRQKGRTEKQHSLEVHFSFNMIRKESSDHDSGNNVYSKAYTSWGHRPCSKLCCRTWLWTTKLLTRK
jgi:hypothetical protein